MISIFVAQATKPSVAKNHLLFAVLDLNGIEYQITRDLDQVATSDLIITDCFVMETPFYSDIPDHELCKNLIKKCAEHSKPIAFYYPSECRTTLDASFNPTGEYLEELQVRGYLIKNGDGDSAGFYKTYNIHEYFAWQITTEFNLGRLTQAQYQIDHGTKHKKFLFLNGENRSHRTEFFNLISQAGLLDQALWSNRRTKEYTESGGPSIDWPNIELHRDFKFDAYYIPHYTQTEFSVISETTPSEFFPTEKTFKPILLGHPFLVATDRYFMKRLGDMGFKTFNGFINEDYDSVRWYNYRIPVLVNEIARLCDCDGILESTKTIREHNRSHIYRVANQAYNHLLGVILDITPVATNDNLPELTSELFESYIRT